MVKRNDVMLETEGVDMALLAAVYALPAEVRMQCPFWNPHKTVERYLLPEAWRIESGLSRVHELERARVIISAEIDRIRTSEVQLELGTATSRPPHREDSGTDRAKGLFICVPGERRVE